VTRSETGLCRRLDVGASLNQDTRVQKFLVALIRPSHYDDDGYVIQWWRGWIPANSPAALYGLALDAKRRQILGARVDLELEVYDEINTVLPLASLIRRFRRNSLKGLVCPSRGAKQPVLARW
jgi:hypothetical protein